MTDTMGENEKNRYDSFMRAPALEPASSWGGERERPEGSPWLEENEPSNNKFETRGRCPWGLALGERAGKPNPLLFGVWVRVRVT